MWLHPAGTLTWDQELDMSDMGFAVGQGLISGVHLGFNEGIVAQTRQELRREWSQEELHKM